LKTTINIADDLLAEAKMHAEREGVTVRALVEQGLRLALNQGAHNKSGFKLRYAAVEGKGLHPEMVGASWEQIRDLAYGIDHFAARQS
jgi:hypothetical protein